MAEYYGFFDGSQQYTQTELARYFDNIYETGIAMVDENTISYNCTLVDGGIKIEPGFALIKGFYHYMDTAITIPVVPGTELKRCSTVIGLDLTTKKISIYVKEGTTAYPAAIRNDTTWELLLNIFYLGTDGCTKLTDRRLSKTYCGILRPKNLSDFNIFMTQCMQQWDKAEWKNIYVQASAPAKDLVKDDLWVELI